MATYIEHTHDNGVEIYHFKSISRDAIDEFYSIAMPIFSDHVNTYRDDVPLFYALDLSETGMYPVKYMMNKAVQEIGKFKYRPQHYIAYVTNNTQDKMLISILEQLSARNLGHTRRVFLPHELNEAVEWLKITREPFIEKFENR